MQIGRRALLASLAAGWPLGALRAQETGLSAKAWTDAEMEAFLSQAKAVKWKTLGTGITQSLRATLDRNGEVRDAHFQSVDEAKTAYQTTQGTEHNFRDSWKYNIAAYRLDRLLGLHMTPPSVEGRIAGRRGAITWWIEGAMMETERVKKKIEPPDQDVWGKQMHVVRLFDQLIFNTDRNLQNLLIAPGWQLWMIDHTRAFRLLPHLRDAKNLERCERHLFERLRSLTHGEVSAATKPFLGDMEVNGVMARRDRILEVYRARIADKGEAAVLYDYSRG